MSSILTMPPEVLCMIFSRDYLNDGDLANSALTCKTLRPAAEYNLFKVVGPSLERQWTRTEAFSGAARGGEITKAWAKRDSLCTALAIAEVQSLVHELHLDSVFKEGMRLSWTWNDATTNPLLLLPGFHNLRLLHLHAKVAQKVLYKALQMPRLETIMMKSIPAPEMINDLYRRPKKVWIYSKGLSVFDIKPFISRPEDVMESKNYRATTGKELIINGSFVADNLQPLVDTMGGLESFIYCADRTECESDLDQTAAAREFNCNDMKFAEFDKLLENQRSSLQKLVLLRNSGFHCEADYTVLGSLTEFTQLHNLRIEDTFFLGHQFHCPNHPTKGTRKSFDIAKLLPDSLERLDLHVDIQELQNFRFYYLDLLEGIREQQEDGHLRKLKHITIEEMPVPEGKRCRICFEAPCPSREELEVVPFGVYSTVEPEHILKIRADCTKRGLKLDYIERVARFSPGNGKRLWAKLYESEDPYGPCVDIDIPERELLPLAQEE